MSATENHQKILRYAELSLKEAQSALSPEEILEKEGIIRDLGISEKEILDTAHTLMQAKY